MRTLSQNSRRATSLVSLTRSPIRKEVSKVMRELAGYHYDPKKYEERVRERRDWSERDSDDE